MTDPFHLQRFVDAQDPIIPLVYEELQHGRKTTHWMWFVFPQLLGLGSSPMAKEFGITSRAEAEAYLGHPILGPRLHHCTELVIQVEGRSIKEIFGHPDDLKFHSSMTLFARVPAETDIFARAIEKYFSGHYDPATVERL